MELVARRIYLIRGQKVMLDADLAELYEVETRALNQAVRRNVDRFPDDFMFQLSNRRDGELDVTICDIQSRSHELGIAMLSSMLRSRRAIQMNITIMRAFVRMRELLASHKSLAEKVEKIEQTQKQHGSILVAVLQDIQKLKTPPQTRAIGFYRSPKKK